MAGLLSPPALRTYPRDVATALASLEHTLPEGDGGTGPTAHPGGANR